MDRKSDQWQDGVNLLLAIWLFISPWTLGYSAITAASWNAWIVGVVLFVLSLASLTQFQRWEEWVNTLLGLWLIVSPWVLGFSINTTAKWNMVIVGVIAGALALWNALAEHRGALTR
jgi:hypothetical protein